MDNSPEARLTLLIGDRLQKVHVQNSLCATVRHEFGEEEMSEPAIGATIRSTERHNGLLWRGLRQQFVCHPRQRVISIGQQLEVHPQR